MQVTSVSRDMSSAMAFRSGDDGAPGQAQQQQQQTRHLEMAPEQQQPQQHPDLLQRKDQQQVHFQGNRRRFGATPLRTYKSCDFCAKRKRKCSGHLPRCSLCIEKKQPFCHYKLKPPLKPSVSKAAATQQRPPFSSSSTSSFGVCVELASKAASASDALVYGGRRRSSVSDGDSVAIVPGFASLKRCRMSPSPATGLVGMEENVYLGDFFECLGILPLAAESTIRSAMVEMLMEAAAEQRNRSDDTFEPVWSSGLTTATEAYTGSGISEGKRLGAPVPNRSGGSLVCRKATGNPAKSIMWCAIALGAIMRGSPVKHVAKYIRLAREFLAECFDGITLDDARAYLIMSFLHGVIRDEEKNERYLSFATSIISRLGPEEVPEELGAMLLTSEEMKIFEATRSRIEWSDLVSSWSNVMNLPREQETIQQKDFCNLFLVTDRRLNQAFIEDMIEQGALDLNNKGRQDACTPGQQVTGTFAEPAGDGTSGHEPERTQKTGQLPVWNDPRLTISRVKMPKAQPAGRKTKDCVQELLPELSRLSTTLGRSDTCAGVGGLLYFGNIAYMEGARGGMLECVQSMETCTRIFARYPGAVRFRTHLAHCILSVGQSFDQPKLYEAMRDAYNLGRPQEWDPAPPFNEWRGMDQICDHALCRCLDAGTGRGRSHLRPGAAADGHSPPVPAVLDASALADVDLSWSESYSQGYGSPPAMPSTWSNSPTAPMSTSPLEPPREIPLEIGQVPRTHEDNLMDGAGKDTHSLPQAMKATGFRTLGMKPAAATAGVRVEVGGLGTRPGQPFIPKQRFFQGASHIQQTMPLTPADLLEISAVLEEEDTSD